jgi:hypothetical protein
MDVDRVVEPVMDGGSDFTARWDTNERARNLRHMAFFSEGGDAEMSFAVLVRIPNCLAYFQMEGERPIAKNAGWRAVIIHEGNRWRLAHCCQVREKKRDRRKREPWGGAGHIVSLHEK